MASTSTLTSYPAKEFNRDTQFQPIPPSFWIATNRKAKMYSNDRTRHHPSSRRHKPSSRSITHSRSRSRSPSIHRDDGDRKRSRSHRHRDRDRDIEDSRDKKRKGHHHHHHHRSRKHEDRPADPPTAAAPQPLPFGSRQLTKRDLAHYEPVLGMYLDIQKNLILEDLSETEVKGRWKSFLGKW